MHYLTTQIAGNQANDLGDRLTENFHIAGVFSPGVGQTMVKIPYSARWVEGNTATGSGPWLDTSGDLHPDDDPLQPGQKRPTAVIDIFSLLSHKLGKEVAQEKIAYVEHIGVRLLNSGNGGNNNEDLSDLPVLLVGTLRREIVSVHTRCTVWLIAL